MRKPRDTPTRTGPPSLPVSPFDAQQSTAAFGRYSRTRTRLALAQTHTLRTLARTGQNFVQRNVWPPAHSRYMHASAGRECQVSKAGHHTHTCRTPTYSTSPKTRAPTLYVGIAIHPLPISQPARCGSLAPLSDALAGVSLGGRSSKGRFGRSLAMRGGWRLHKGGRLLE